MQHNLERAKATIEKLNEVCKDSWDSPRARMYIATHINVLENSTSALVEELKYEREVHKRVEAALAKRLDNDPRT